MKTRLFILVLAALPVLVASRQIILTPSGRIVSQQRVCPSGFTSVNVSSAIDLVLENGPEHLLRVECRENVIQYVETVIVHGVMTIRLEDGLVLRGEHDEVKVYLTLPTLTVLTASGACEIATRGTISSDLPLTIVMSGACEMEGGFSAGTIDISTSGTSECDLRLRSAAETSISMSGTGEMEADIECGPLKLTASGAADMELEGKCGPLNVTVSGACSMKCEGLVADSFEGNLTGASSGRFTCTGRYKWKTTGAASLKINGNGM